MTSKNLLCVVALFLAAPLARAADKPTAMPPAPAGEANKLNSAPASAAADANKVPEGAAKAAAADKAAADKAAADKAGTTAQQTAKPNAPVEEIVHGFYVQMRLGGGYMVKGDSIPYDPAYPTLQGSSEELGAGPAVDFAIGYDIIEEVAIQAVGGMTFSGGRRTDRARGLDVAYGGLGVRLSFPIHERLNFTVTPEIVYAYSNTAVDPSTKGLGIVLNGGIEYYAHVRHISLGLDLSVQVPISPVRVWVGLMPNIKYTF